MGRDDLYITIPSFFRCPISLDVMKSPVSLSTGVTYDRASIQRWLDSGNNTCPATMQVLQSKDLVPNKTLQRLIQIWSESTRLLHRVDSPDSSRLTQNDVARLVQDFHPENLVRIERFARESDENKKFLARLSNFSSVIVEFISDDNGSEEAVKILELILNYIDEKENLKSLILKKNNKKCLSSLLRVLQVGKIDSKIASTRVLEATAIDPESKVLIADTEGLLSSLVNSIGVELKDHIGLIEASLDCLIAVTKTKRVKTKLVNLQVIKFLTSVLKDSNSTVLIIEKSLRLLETILSCREGRVEISENVECISATVHKLLKVSSVATEHAVTILWSVCYLFRDLEAQEAVMKSNGLTKILLIMQSNCSPAVRQMAGDLIKVLRVGGNTCLGSYDTKTTHIMPF